MTLAGISLSYLRVRNMGALLNVVVLALAVAAITLLVLTAEQLEERTYLDARGIDAVVSAQGSALQIVLASVYHLDAPGGTMPWPAAQAIAARPGVKKAIPIAVADHYDGFRIVGTTHDYLTHYHARLRAGELWRAPLEVVIGSEVALRTPLRVGSTFVPAHAERVAAHDERQYRVAGVLWPTGSVVDRLILTDLASVWSFHPPPEPDSVLITEPAPDDTRTITALLVQFDTPVAGAALLREINSRGDLQAASPIIETARLFGLTVMGMRVLRGFSLILVIAAGLSLFIGLYSVLNERRYDLAIMRALGASPAQLMALLLFEGVLLTAIGAAVGLLLGHALTSLLGYALRFEQVSITGWIWSNNELWIVAGALVVGVLAALLPAWRAHDTDIAQVLARG